jgi:hypothetical protein
MNPLVSQSKQAPTVACKLTLSVTNHRSRRMRTIRTFFATGKVTMACARNVTRKVNADNADLQTDLRLKLHRERIQNGKTQNDGYKMISLQGYHSVTIIL